MLRIKVYEGNKKMIYENFLEENQEEEEFLQVASRFNDEGLYQYIYWRMKNDTFTTTITPVSHKVHIIYVRSGCCMYDSTLVKAGDIYVTGLNKHPIVSKFKEIAMFTVDMDFAFYYRLTGMVPSLFCDRALLIEEGNPFYQLGTKLFKLPLSYWVSIAENFIGNLLEVSEYAVNYQLKSVIQASRQLKNQKDLDVFKLSDNIDVSYRQLQRYFTSILGLTPKEYISILRFNKAFLQLKDNNFIDAALGAGYYDQSHMIREFKSIAGCTPTKFSKHKQFLAM